MLYMAGTCPLGDAMRVRGEGRHDEEGAAQQVLHITESYSWR